MTKASSSSFCVFCGQRLDPQPAAVCPDCGIGACADCIAEGNSECPDCHKPLAASGEAQPGPRPAEGSAAAPAQSNAADESAEPGPGGTSSAGGATTKAPDSPTQRSAATGAPYDVGLYDVDPDGWRPRGRFQSEHAGPRIAFGGVLASFIAAVGLAVLILASVSGHCPVSIGLALSDLRGGGRGTPDAGDMKGEWTGKFAGKPAVLYIAGGSGGSFYGQMRVTEKTGETKVAIDGAVHSDRRLSFAETKVLQTPDRGSWMLGHNRGKLSRGRRSISGTGKHSDRKCRWRFRKR